VVAGAAGGYSVHWVGVVGGGEDDGVEGEGYHGAEVGREEEWGCDPAAVLTGRLQGGAVRKTASILDCKMPYQFNIDVIGTEGTIRDNRVWSEPLLPGQTGWATVPTILPDSGDVTHHPFTGQIEAFVAGILDNQPILPDLDDATRTHEVIFAADRSAEQNRPICLPLAP